MTRRATPTYGGGVPFLQERKYTSRSAEAPELTPREREVLNRLAEGRSTKEVARDLDISVNTCRVHIHAILYKLDVHSQLAAVVRAARLGLLTDS